MAVLEIPQRMVLFNKICFLISALSLTFGMLVFFLLNYLLVFYIELFITVIFLGLPFFSRKMGLNASMTIALVILGSAFVYYGVLIGPISQIYVYAGFLIGSTLLLVKNKAAIIFCISYVALMVIFLELSYYFHWFKPIEMPYLGQMLVRWVVIMTGSFSTSIVFYFYFKEWTNGRVEQLLIDLEKANAAKSVYLRETSHEIRTPLTSIFGIAQLLHSRKNDLANQLTFPDLSKEIDYLYEASGLAREIINNILDLSKIEAGKLNEVRPDILDFRNCIEGCIRMQRYMADARGIRMLLNYSPDLPDLIVSDRIILAKIINNLSSNAVKFAPQHTNVHFNVSLEDQNILFTSRNPGALSPEQYNTIFKPFVSSQHNFANGTGLGLPITKYLTELIGGSISVAGVGESTVFSLRFPYKIAEGELQRETTVLSNDTLNGMLVGYKVLCIEDNEIFEFILKKFLAELGAEIMMAENGQDAFLIMESFVPDLIISDTHMPVMGGKEFLLTLRKHPQLAQIPVIITSGDAFDQEQEDMLQAGASDFLVKPFLLSDLYISIHNHLPVIKLLSYEK